MCGTSTKQKVLEALGRLPSDATFEDAIERGLAELDAQPEGRPRSGRVVPELNDQALREVVRGNYRVVYRQQGWQRRHRHGGSQRASLPLGLVLRAS